MSTNEDYLDLVIGFVRRAQAGDSTTVDEFMTAHPELGAETRTLIEQVLNQPETDTPTLRGKLEESAMLSQTLLVDPEDESNYFDGRYRKISLLGEGGYGKVFLVADKMHDGERVALKVIRKVHTSADLGQRFRNEIRVLRALTHPGIPAIFNDGTTSDGELYYTMSFVDGRTLSDVLLEEAPLDIERIVRMGLQLLDVLVYAHAQGVVHRDLKPSNIILLDAGTEKERVQVLDFGIAKILRHEGLLEQARTLGTDVPLGTPHYMAPEQVRGQVEDGRTDLYALGIILFQMCSGRLPFQGKTSMEILIARLENRPRELNGSEAPAWLRDLVKAVLRRRKDKRPSSEEVKTIFETAALGGAVARQGRRAAVVFGTLAVLALGAAAGVGLKWGDWNEPPTAAEPRATASAPSRPGEAVEREVAEPDSAGLPAAVAGSTGAAPGASGPVPSSGLPVEASSAADVEQEPIAASAARKDEVRETTTEPAAPLRFEAPPGLQRGDTIHINRPKLPLKVAGLAHPFFRWEGRAQNVMEGAQERGNRRPPRVRARTARGSRPPATATLRRSCLRLRRGVRDGAAHRGVGVSRTCRSSKRNGSRCSEHPRRASGARRRTPRRAPWRVSRRGSCAAGAATKAKRARSRSRTVASTRISTCPTWMAPMS